jgi:hypothetical protein
LMAAQCLGFLALPASQFHHVHNPPSAHNALDPIVELPYSHSLNSSTHANVCQGD